MIILIMIIIIVTERRESWMEQTLELSVTRSRWLAEQGAIRNLLNSYLRETGHISFITPSGVESPAEPASGRWAAVQLPLTGEQLIVSIVYESTIGLHEYGTYYYAGKEGGALQLLEAASIVEKLLMELSLYGTGEQEDEQNAAMRCDEMRQHIHNSIHKTSLYLQHYLDQQYEWDSKAMDYIASEQSVLLGHPFHPLPKSSEGFSNEDLWRYAPELQASFQLHYIAVKQELLSETWVETNRFTAPSVLASAAEKLGQQLDEYSILPLHPWQAKYVSQIDSVASLIEGRQLVDLGPLGDVVYPTSSVRTVWVPELQCFIKLPLHVRITNLIRENSAEYIQRTLDAARVIYHLSDHIEHQSFRILKEAGYQTVELSNHVDAERLMSSFGVFYREADALDAEERNHCFVVASLLERLPEKQDSKLLQVIKQSNDGQVPDLFAWLEQYLQISMMPMLRLLADYGISFEAHVQNALISIKQGQPVCFYLRDLEGMSVIRSQALEAGWLSHLITPDSPLLYTGEEAWSRMKYYFFVNHLGALIHNLAKDKGTSEADFWSIVTETLRKEWTVNKEQHPRLASYMKDLLEQPKLPAKANFISRFKGRGETPLFVQIPNPMVMKEVK